MVLIRGKRVGWIVKGKEGHYMVTEDDLTLGGGYIMQYMDHVS